MPVMVEYNPQKQKRVYPWGFSLLGLGWVDNLSKRMVEMILKSHRLHGGKQSSCSSTLYYVMSNIVQKHSRSEISL